MNLGGRVVVVRTQGEETQLALGGLGAPINSVWIITEIANAFVVVAKLDPQHAPRWLGQNSGWLDKPYLLNVADLEDFETCFQLGVVEQPVGMKTTPGLPWEGMPLGG